MKAGRSLQELAAEITRQSFSKKDYIADTRALSFEVRNTGSNEHNIFLNGINGGMPLRPIAHGQMASALSIPKPYYDRMLADAPDLLAANVNRWLTTQPARRMVRTLDGNVRAILSDSYRPLDSLDLAEAILPTLQQLDAKVESCEMTDARFYLKAITDRVQGEVKKGDVIKAGLVVSNSEVGMGSLRIEELDYRLLCLNGMIGASSVRKAHLGRNSGRGTDAIEDAREFFRDETRTADDRAFFLKVRDAAASMFNVERFNVRIDKYRDAAERQITADPVKVVEQTARRLDLNETERSSVLTHLIRGGDLSAWGLANAVTRASQDVNDYDRATVLEGLGSDIIELKPSEWRVLTTTTAA